MNKLKSFFAYPFFTDKKYIISIWIVLALVTGLKNYLRNDPSIGRLTYNNYNIFTGVYDHMVKQTILYGPYPEEYFDANHYGPFFSMVIAPFALLPDGVGIILWNISLTCLLAFSIFKLPIKESFKVAICWIILNELITAQLALQFNIALVALVLLTFSYVREHSFWKGSAAIVIGFLVKLYGIIGFAFLLFLKSLKLKLSFIAKFFIVLLIGFILPIFITSPQFILQSYQDWYEALKFKSDFNQNESDMANISVIGFSEKVFGLKMHVLHAVGFGFSVLMAIFILRRNQLHQLKFQLFTLCYLLLCLVLFNTNVESPTYIIAFVAIGIWFVLVEKSIWTISIFLFAILLTSLSPTDLFPRFIRQEYVQPYKLKVLPCIIIWIDLAVRLFVTNFTLPKHQVNLLHEAK